MLRLDKPINQSTKDISEKSINQSIKDIGEQSINQSETSASNQSINRGHQRAINQSIKDISEQSINQSRTSLSNQSHCPFPTPLHFLTIFHCHCPLTPPQPPCSIRILSVGARCFSARHPTISSRGSASESRTLDSAWGWCCSRAVWFASCSPWSGAGPLDIQSPPRGSNWPRVSVNHPRDHRWRTFWSGRFLRWYWANQERDKWGLPWRIFLPAAPQKLLSAKK